MEENLDSRIQSIGKYLPQLSIGATSFCFVLGLIIVNLHLGRYGVHSSEFARADYILVGGVFVVLVAIAGICWKLIVGYYTWAEKQWDNKKHLRAVVAFVLAVIIIFGTIFLVTGFLIVKSKFTSVRDIITPFTSVLFVYGALNGFYSNMLPVVHKTKLTGIDLKNQVVDALTFLPMLLLGIAMYAGAVYPNMSSAWGGGYKPPMMLLPTERGVEVGRALALPVVLNTSMIGPIEVLSESEKELVILVPEQLEGKDVAIRIGRELFDAIQPMSMMSR